MGSHIVISISYWLGLINLTTFCFKTCGSYGKPNIFNIFLYVLLPYRAPQYNLSN